MAIFSTDELQAFTGIKPQPLPARGPRKTRGRGGTLTSLLSEGGAAGGAAIGTALLPGIGTVIGAGLGGLAGRLAENKVRDDEFRFGEAAKEGALSAALTGAGSLFKAAKGARAASKAVGAADDVTKAATRNTLERASQRSLGNAWGIRSGVDLNGRVLTPQRVGKLQRFVTDELRVPKTANADRVLEFAANHQDTTGRAISDLLRTSASNIDRTALTKTLKGRFNSVLGSGGAKNPLATDILTQIKNAKTPEQLWQVRRNVDDLINFGAKEASAVPGSQNIARATRQEINKALQGVEGYKQLSRSYSNASDVVKLAGAAAKTPRGARLPGMLGGVAGDQVQSARAAAGQVAGAVGRGQASLAGVLSAPVARGARSGLTASLLSKPFTQSPGENMDMTNPMTNIQANTSNMPELSAFNDISATPTSPFAPENVEANAQAILQQGGDFDDVMKYVSLVEALASLGGGGAGKPMSSEASKTISNAQAGLEALGDFEGIISADPSSLRKTVVPGRGAFGGALGNAIGTSSLDAASQQIIDVIARLRTGAAISKTEEERFKKFIPNAFDSEDVRAQKLGYLRRQFQRVAERASGAGTDLEAALVY